MLPHWTEHDIEVDGASLHYYRTGAGEKPPLMLLHGFSDNGLCWMPVARELEAGWDVILPDARGHGKSARVEAGGTYDHPADTAALIRALGLKDPVLGGHSMGAATASTVEARFPRLVKALILEDPPWREWAPAPVEEEKPDTPPANPWWDWLVSLPEKSLDEIIAKGKADNPDWPDVEFPVWAESKRQFDVNVLQAEGFRMGWREVVKAINVPTLLITADREKGGIVSLEDATEAARLSDCIRIAHVPGVGHNIRRENFTRFMEVVKAFLTETKAQE